MKQENTALNVDNTIIENITSIEKPKETNSKVIPLKMLKLLKLNEKIRKLRESVVKEIKEELQEIDKTCKEAKNMIGELNGKGKDN